MAGTRFVKVEVNVGDLIMSVLVKMEITAPAERFGRCADTQEDDHERHNELEDSGKAFGDDDAQCQHETPNDGQRYRVAGAPQPAYPGSLGEFSMFTDNGRDCYNMVYFGRVF